MGERFIEGKIGGIVLRGICYLDNGDGIKTQILMLPGGRILCKDEDVVPSSIFHVDNDANEDGDIELLLLKCDVPNVETYNNIITSLGYKHVSNVNDIINGDNEFLIKEYIN